MSEDHNVRKFTTACPICNGYDFVGHCGKAAREAGHIAEKDQIAALKAEVADLTTKLQFMTFNRDGWAEKAGQREQFVNGLEAQRYAARERGLLAANDSLTEEITALRDDADRMWRKNRKLKRKLREELAVAERLSGLASERLETICKLLAMMERRPRPVRVETRGGVE